MVHSISQIFFELSRAFTSKLNQNMAASEDIVCVADLVCLNPGVPKVGRMYFNILGMYHDSKHRLPITPRSKVIENVRNRIFLDQICSKMEVVKNDLSIVRSPSNFPTVFWDRNFHPQFQALLKINAHLRSLLSQKQDLLTLFRRSQRSLLRKIQILEHDLRDLQSLSLDN